MAKAFYTLIAESVAEDLTEWKNFRNLELQHKQENKNGALSLGYHAKQLETQIYNQLATLSPEDLEKVKKTFSEEDWKSIIYILRDCYSTPDLTK